MLCISTVTLLLAAICFTEVVLSTSVSTKPNVLFIVVDDLSPIYEQYGWPAKADNLRDHVAAHGVTFSRAYVSVAVCAPSRTAFLTGLRPDTTQAWTIGPYFRNTSRGQGMQVVTLPQMFRMNGYNTTGAGKIFHPGTPSGGLSTSEGGGDMCPMQSSQASCAHAPATDEPGSWTEPYWFCDQYTNDTVQSPAMQQHPCSLHGQTRSADAVYSWPSCGGGCVQPDSCIACFTQCGTWGKGGAWDACDCPDECYPEGLIAAQSIRVLEDKAANPGKGPWFHAMGFKRPHLSYRAPLKYFDMYNLSAVTLPVHPLPSPSAPAISYSHSCINDNHYPASDSVSLEDRVKFGLSALAHDDAKHNCQQMVLNKTHGPSSAVEINTAPISVRQLRLAYYASVTFMDAQLGRVLAVLKRTGLSANTIVTFIGDHGYQNGQKGEWTKCNNFELATRIPMHVILPTGWTKGNPRRGVLETAIVESVDLMPTLAELADIPFPPHQRMAGQSFASLLVDGPSGKRKSFALSQWPRRPSCTQRHGCLDGHGDPSAFTPDQAVMGYTLRVDQWRYTAWFKFDWNRTEPVWDAVTATELYSHAGDTGDMHSGETLEYDNLALDPSHKSVAAALHDQLVEIVKTGLVPPMTVTS